MDLYLYIFSPTFSALLITGGTLAITGTYLLVTFAPHTSTHITAHLVQYYAVSWHFLLYLVSSECETLAWCPRKHFSRRALLPWSRGFVSPPQATSRRCADHGKHVSANKAAGALLLIIFSPPSTLWWRGATGGWLLWVNYGVKVLLIPLMSWWITWPLRIL